MKRHLEFKKTSVHTKDKIQDLGRYIGKFINSNNKSLDKFNEEDIVLFLNSLPYAINTMNYIRVNLKVFIKWYFEDWSARFRNLDRICKQQKAPRTYTPEDMISLKEIKKIADTEEDLMYKTYWVVFFYGGFRPSEACALKWENIFFEKEGTIIKLRAPKTGKDFYKSLPKEAEHLLKEWRKYNNSEWVFPSPVNKDSHITNRAICGRLKKLSMKAIGRAVVPYALRHSVATILYQDDNRKDDDVARQLGHHKSMKATYLNLDAEKIKSQARKIWVKAEALPPEEREQLEIKIDKLTEENKYLFLWVQAYTDHHSGKISDKEGKLRLSAINKIIKEKNNEGI